MKIGAIQIERDTVRGRRSRAVGRYGMVMAVALSGTALFAWTHLGHRARVRSVMPATVSFTELLTTAKQHPEDVSHLVMLGWRAQQLGQDDLAQACFRRATRLGGRAVAERISHPPVVSPDLLQRDADSFLAERKVASAERAYRCTLARNPRNAAALQGLGLSLLASDRMAEATARLLEATRLDPRQARAQLALGLLYRDMGLALPARRHLEAATQADPNNVHAWAALGELCAVDLGYQSSVAEAYPEAETAFGHVVALRPDSVLFRLNWADMQAQNHELNAAEANYRLALKQTPDSPDALLRLSRFLIESRPDTAALQEAAELLGRALKQDPTNLNVVILLGRLAQLRGQYGRAADLLRRATARRPGDASLWYALSLCERRNGQAALAEVALIRSRTLQERMNQIRRQEDLVRVHPDDEITHLRLARLNAQSGRYAKAINEYQVCLGLNARNRAVSRELEALEAQLKAHGQMPEMSAFNVMLAAATR